MSRPTGKEEIHESEDFQGENEFGEKSGRGRDGMLVRVF